MSRKLWLSETKSVERCTSCRAKDVAIREMCKPRKSVGIAKILKVGVPNNVPHSGINSLCGLNFALNDHVAKIVVLVLKDIFKAIADVFGCVDLHDEMLVEFL